MAKKFTKKKIVLVLNILVILGLAASTGFLYLKNRDLNETVSLSESDRQKIKNDKYIEEIGKSLTLPGEEPIFVINVVDPEKAGNDNPELLAIFGDLKKDDFIVVYKKAKLGIQYRPLEKKIVKTNTVVLPIVVEIIGSKEAIALEETKLREFGNQITIVKTEKEGIIQSFIFDVESDQATETESIAKLLAHDVGTTLPAGITPTKQAEIVIALSSTPSSIIPTSTETTPATEQQP